MQNFSIDEIRDEAIKQASILGSVLHPLRSIKRLINLPKENAELKRQLEAASRPSGAVKTLLRSAVSPTGLKALGITGTVGTAGLFGAHKLLQEKYGPRYLSDRINFNDVIASAREEAKQQAEANAPYINWQNMYKDLKNLLS